MFSVTLNSFNIPQKLRERERERERDRNGDLFLPVMSGQISVLQPLQLVYTSPNLMLKDVLCILNYKRNIHVFPKNEAPSIEVNQSKLQNDSN